MFSYRVSTRLYSLTQFSHTVIGRALVMTHSVNFAVSFANNCKRFSHPSGNISLQETTPTRKQLIDHIIVRGSTTNHEPIGQTYTDVVDTTLDTSGEHAPRRQNRYIHETITKLAMSAGLPCSHHHVNTF